MPRILLARGPSPTDAAAAPWPVVVTCEHASRAVPARLRAWLPTVPDDHRAWDPGAAQAAGWLAARLGAECIAGTCTRLLVDLNRSADHPQAFGRAVRGAPPAVRAGLLADCWQPFRAASRQALARAAAPARGVLHLSVHSFVPVLHGRVRRTDIGLLSDPSRAGEQRVVREWQRRLATRTGLRVHRNAPYRGWSDGHTTALRHGGAPAGYAGIELELNQRLWDGRAWRPGLLVALLACLRATLATPSIR